jgi:hypothetical protein
MDNQDIGPNLTELMDDWKKAFDLVFRAKSVPWFDATINYEIVLPTKNSKSILFNHGVQVKKTNSKGVISYYFCCLVGKCARL